MVASNGKTEGLRPPKAVKDATAAYLEAEDALAAWIEEACERDQQHGAVIRAVRVLEQLGELRRRASRQHQTLFSGARIEGL